MRLLSNFGLLIAVSCFSFAGCAQQRVDNDFVPKIDKPLFQNGDGPSILIDGGHNNFHTLEDKFAPFGKAVQLYGFRVRSSSGQLDSTTLKGTKILVIANALNAKNTDSWEQPVFPAFTPQEVEQVREWVWNGGRLFLISDHMPFAGAAATLAKVFGYTFYDGFALRRPKRPNDIFTNADSTLTHNDITDLHGGIDSIVSFTGQAFSIPENATSILTVDTSYKILLPDIAWEFNDKTKIVDAVGLSQLAYSSYGAGKIVVAGEAAMFTAQRVGKSKIGFNAHVARHNVQLLLNILEWLNE